MGGGGSGGGGPTQSTVTNTNIPEYARPYVETMLGATQQQLFNTKQTPEGATEITGVKGYTPFGAGGGQPAGQYNPFTGQFQFGGAPRAPSGGIAQESPIPGLDQNAINANPQGYQQGLQRAQQQESAQPGSTMLGQQYATGMGPQEMAAANAAVAGFSPLQQQAQQGIASLQMPGQFGAATDAAMMATQSALGAGQYQPQYFGNQFRAPGQYAPGQFSMVQAQAPELTQYQMGGPERVGTQAFTGENVGQYMSPYMQSVVNAQQREAQRASDIAGTQLAGKATQAGAFGGSRYGLLEAERQRNLATQLGDIQATGSQAAFQNAQQQFNAQQQSNLQAQLANQQAGLTAGGQNLQALLGIQQLGAGQNLQAQLANQQALQAAQQAAEQSRQYGYGQAMTAAQQRAQYGLAGQQAAEQSRQFGAGLGLQGAQTGLQGAGQLAGIGAQQLGAQQGILGLQAQTGAQQQAQQQNLINQMLQNYATTQQYPQQQLAFMNAMLRGLPLQTTSTQSYQAAPSTLSQLTGLGVAGAGAYGLMNRKKGGAIKEPKKDAPAGLADLALMKMGV